MVFQTCHNIESEVFFIESEKLLVTFKLAKSFLEFFLWQNGKSQLFFSPIVVSKKKDIPFFFPIFAKFYFIQTLKIFQRLVKFSLSSIRLEQSDLHIWIKCFKSKKKQIWTSFSDVALHKLHQNTGFIFWVSSQYGVNTRIYNQQPLDSRIRSICGNK